MKEILNHLLGTCGEGHISIISLMSMGVIVVYKDYVLTIIREVKDVMFK
jgi:hypothetical protein